MISGSLQSSIVTVSFGSNHGDRERNVAAAISWFETVATGCRVSSIYETPEVNGHGTPYMNAVASGCTNLDYCALNRLAKDFEVECGRDADCRKRGVVPIDIDIVIWKSETLRPLDFSRDFFQIGYREILPAACNL